MEAATRLAFPAGRRWAAPQIRPLGLPGVGPLPLQSPGVTRFKKVRAQQLSRETQKQQGGPAPRDQAARDLPVTGGLRAVIRDEPPSLLGDIDVHALVLYGESRRRHRRLAPGDVDPAAPSRCVSAELLRFPRVSPNVQELPARHGPHRPLFGAIMFLGTSPTHPPLNL